MGIFNIQKKLKCSKDSIDKIKLNVNSVNIKIWKACFCLQIDYVRKAPRRVRAAA